MSARRHVYLGGCVYVPLLEWKTLPKGLPDIYQTGFGNTSDFRFDIFQFFYHERF